MWARAGRKRDGCRRDASFVRGAGGEATLTDDQIRHLSGGLLKGFGEPQNPVVAGVGHIQVPALIDDNSNGSGEAGGAGSAGSIGQGSNQVHLADHDVGFLAIGKPDRAAKAKDTVVAGIGNIQAGRAGSGIEGYRLG